MIVNVLGASRFWHVAQGGPPPPPPNWVCDDFNRVVALCLEV